MQQNLGPSGVDVSEARRLLYGGAPYPSKCPKLTKLLSVASILHLREVEFSKSLIK